MNVPNEDSEDRGKDTSPLTLSQLSEHELRTICEIEERLQEAPEARSFKEEVDPLNYCQKTQKRDPRVLLLNGGRGSGKTSLLLTMAAWWHEARRDPSRHRTRNRERNERIAKLKLPGLSNADIPENVRVLRIIDFDPLPQEMPLIAGIVQAWKPFADHCDLLSGHDHKDGLLADDWESLFQVATAGWTPIGGRKGLVEQLLDREEQVKNWYGVSETWQRFVGRAIARGRECKQYEGQGAKPVFVIMIDDVDLQVRRIRELLPALRMLYHPNVFFIVAADRRHMVDMLQLDFQGQQRGLGETRFVANAPGRFDHWPKTLAEAAFQKVFAPANEWSLHLLGLREWLLEFPNMKAALNEWHSPSEKLGKHNSLGNYLDTVDSTGRFFHETVAQTVTEGKRAARSSRVSDDNADRKDPLELPAIMSYRRAHQLRELVKVRGHSRNTAVELMGKLLEGTDSSSSQIRLSDPRDGRDRKLEYLVSGELAAVFPKVYSVEIDPGKEIVLGGLPKFTFRDGRQDSIQRDDEQSDIWPPLLAASLRADGFGLVAPGLQWNVYLAFAWTRVQLPDGLGLPFWWGVHLLPSPIRFAAWSRDWAKFIQQLSERAERTGGREDRNSQRERVVYGWIYHQLSWMRTSPFPKHILEPLDANTGAGNLEQWHALLELEPDKGLLKKEGDTEEDSWKNRTLPLLARPELFLPPGVQELLLKRIDKSRNVIDELRLQRKKLITDAFAAARYASNLSQPLLESPQEVNTLATHFNAEYESFYNKQPSPWLRIVDAHLDKRAGGVGTDQSTPNN